MTKAGNSMWYVILWVFAVVVSLITLRGAKIKLLPGTVATFALISIAIAFGAIAFLGSYSELYRRFSDSRYELQFDFPIIAEIVFISPYVWLN